ETEKDFALDTVISENTAKNLGVNGKSDVKINDSDDNGKVLVLDTNVILHDPDCINSFEDNDVVIPIGVIEELDNFKKGSEIINHNARKFIREIDGHDDSLFNGGSLIAPGKGKISVKLESVKQEALKEGGFDLNKVDHQILNTVAALVPSEGSKGTKRPVILVSKDTNLRMKARAIGLLAEDYTSDYVENVEKLCKDPQIIEGVPSELIDQLYKDELGLESLDELVSKPLLANEFLILRNGSKSVLTTFDANSGSVRKVHVGLCAGIRARNAEQNFALDVLTNEKIKLVSITGKAGTGKTLLALAAALEQKSRYRQIYLARPIVPLSNKDIGYLPGDISSKISPYTQPLFDNLGVIQSQSRESKNSPHFRDLIEDEKLVISALSYIRGRSLAKIFFIVDEAQ
ncbi:PhoH family protein, partial [Candidatus Pacearchaeota archaeon]|nr:PhoH family protein [Candidatus Pacearchaeota archaeon]